MPVIDSIIPNNGGVGTIITIKGTNLLNTTGDNPITINRVKVSILQSSPTALQVMVPVTRTGPVTMATASGQASGPVFTYARSAIVAVREDQSLTGGYGIAAYWSGGKLYPLTGGNSNAEAHGVATSGSDFLVVGHEYNGGSRIAKIWKNGVGTAIGPAIGFSDALCIDTAGNDIYIGGCVTNGAQKIATIWKNNVATYLTDGTNDAVVNAVAISGSDVYACGYESNGSVTVAKYWKNGTATALTSGQYNGSANDITIAGGAVLIVGYQGISGYRYNALLWNNGVPVVLPVDQYSGYANSIAILGGNTQIGGHYYHSFDIGAIGGIWTNGSFSVQYSFHSTDINSVVIDGTDVYAAGTGYGTRNVLVAKYWKNNDEVILNDASKGGVANDIIVR